MTADDLLWNWARGEWQGQLPHPLPPPHCASAERAYQAPAHCDESDSPVPVNWEAHALIDGYYKKQTLANQRILQFEYTRRHEFFDAKHHIRHEKAARIIGISAHDYRHRLGIMKAAIEILWRK